MAVNKKKLATAAVAVATAATLLLGGTFAWQSINQTALNESSDVVNPGGRLHDDFNGENKDVYVENFADEEIFARVRLEEFFEITQAGGTVHSIAGTRDADGNVDGYDIHYFDAVNDTDAYWDWQTGGSTVFMPTFNKNKDSLVADINGTYNGVDGIVTDEATDDRYTDYEKYTYGQKITDDAIYDYDSNDVDEFVDGSPVVDENYTSVSEEHTAKNTLGAKLMSMQEWIDAGSPVGEYWVYDTDGWVYWADAIQPDTATGLLLDGIALDDKMDDSWYYAINVVAQFVTADDLGSPDDNDGLGSGFYKDGETVTSNALTLLKKIGVDVSGTEEPQTYALYLNYAEDQSVNAKAGDYITLSVEESYTVEDEDENGELVSTTYYGDLSSITVRDTEWSKLIADSDYTYDSGTNTLVILNEDVSEVTVYDQSGMFAGTVYLSESGVEDEEPEVIDQPLDVYVSYENGAIAGSQPINPETGESTEGVIQIFAIGIENKPMYLGGKLTREDGSVLDSRDAYSGLTVSYTFEAYDAYMALTHVYADNNEYSDTFTISTINDETSPYNGYKVATCDQTNEQMVALNEETGHLVMLAEDQPLNQTLTVKATTDYNGTTYESNPQLIFFVNRDINIFLDGEPASEEGYYGYYAPGEEKTFTMTAELLFENEPDTSRTITWSILDEDSNEITDASVTVTPDSESSYTATVVVSEEATGDYTVLATYNHTEDDGKNKGLYQTGWGIRSTESGGEEEYVPTLNYWIDASPNGYIQTLSNNNVTLSLIGRLDADDVTAELTNVTWSVTSSVVSEETKITESSSNTANLYVASAETEPIEISADFEYDGQPYTTTYILNNEPQVGSMVIFMDNDHTQYLETTYTPGEETSVVLDAQYFPLYTGSIQDYDAAYSGEYEVTFANKTSFYLAEIDDEGDYGNETTIEGVTFEQDSVDKSKVTVTIGSEVNQSFGVVCFLESGMLVGFDFVPESTTN